MANIVQRSANRLHSSVENYLPHSIIFVVVLTIIAYILALVWTPAGPLEIVIEWYGQFWGFLEFAMQMTLIIVTGYGIATSPPVRKALAWLAKAPNSPAQAYLSVVVVGFALSYVNWGIGMVGAAFYAIVLALERDDLDFGFLIATAYIAIWPGITGSITVTAPILVNTPGHFMEDAIGLIPLTETIFTPLHLSVVWAIFIFFLLLIYLMSPEEQQAETPSQEDLQSLMPKYHETDEERRQHFAERLNINPTWPAIIVLMGAIYIGYLAFTEGLLATLGLNSVNFIFLMIGILLHGNLKNYALAISDGAERAGQVILQFPFYGGIQGILIGTGLAAIMVEAIVDIATQETFGFLVFLITGILNIFVPSAGGQYIVMADILHSAGGQIGVADWIVISTYTMGDLWTNMLIPFWALPILGIAGLRVRDIWGYVIMGLLTYGVIAGTILLIAPFIGLI